MASSTVGATLSRPITSVQLRRSKMPCSLSTGVSRPGLAFPGRHYRSSLRVAPVAAARPDKAVSSTSGRPAKQLVSQQQQEESFKLPDWAKFATRGAVAIGLAVVLALGSVTAAEAARSGGRVGGSRFSSSRAPSSSYSRSGGSSLGGSMGGYSSYGGSLVAPRTSMSFGYSVGLPSFFFPMGGYGYGYAVGQPAGPSFFSILFFVLVAAVLFQVISGMMAGDEDGGSFGGERVAVGKLQIALLGSARSLQTDLDRIASKADTSSAEGLAYVLQEAVLSLQRNPDYWVYGSSDVQFERSFDDAEGAFNELSLEERSKFRQETLSNVGGDTRRKEYSGSRGGDSELIVVTLLVAADAPLKLPKISGNADMRTALNRIGAVPVDSLVAVEVLWTPQDPNDYMTRDEVLADYPSLAVL